MIDLSTSSPLLTCKAEFLECLLQSFPGRIVVKDLEGRYRYMNHDPPAAAAVSVSSEVVVEPTTRNWFGQTDVEFYNGDYETARRVREADQTCIRTGKPVITTFSTSQETIHFPLIQQCPDNPNEHSEIVGVCGLTVDIATAAAAAAGKQETNNNNNTSCGSKNKNNTKRSHNCFCEKEEEEEPITTLPDHFSHHHHEPHHHHHQQHTELEGSMSKSSDSEVAESDYRDIFRNIETAVALCEVLTNEQGNKPIDFRYLQVNPAFSRAFGIPRDQILGKCVTQVFPGIEHDDANWIDLFCNAALTGVNAHFVQYSHVLDKWYSGVAYRPYPDSDRRFNVFFMDHSDHIQSQEALRESQECHKNLFENMLQGVVYQNLDGDIIAANPAAERILGLSVDQMMGRSSVDPRWKSTHEDGTDFPGNEHPSMVAIKTGKPVTNVTMGVFHPQEELQHWIKIDAIPRFKPGETKPYQVYTTFTDITDMVRFEKELLRAKEKAEGADQLKSAFLANMSHEIRTPLNGIIGHIDLALANGLTPSFRDENLDGLRIAKSSGELLISIIQDILDLSKIEAGQLTVQDSEFSLYDLADHSADIVRTLIKARNKNITFTACVDPAVSNSQMGDSFRIQQVVNNLVSNAVKFTSEGKVEFSIKLVEVNGNKMLEYSVLDTGKGIPESHLRTVFEPFRQVDFTDTRQHGGTGLGLTISQKLVELMHGKLRVESSVLGPLRGSFFAFTIPYRPCQHPKHPEPAASAVAHVTEIKPGSDLQQQPGASIGTPHPSTKFIFKGKILVAEDDPISRRLVHRMLQITTGLCSSDILLACDGEEAVSLYQNNFKDIAMILMDVQMPKLDGLEATKKIRDLEASAKRTDPKARNRPQVPIVALSAGAMKGDHERGIAVGMSDYLTKPVNFKSLARTLEHFWGQEGAAAAVVVPIIPDAGKPLAQACGQDAPKVPIQIARVA